MVVLFARLWPLVLQGLRPDVSLGPLVVTISSVYVLLFFFGSYRLSYFWHCTAKGVFVSSWDTVLELANLGRLGSSFLHGHELNLCRSILVLVALIFEERVWDLAILCKIVLNRHWVWNSVVDRLQSLNIASLVYLMLSFLRGYWCIFVIRFGSHTGERLTQDVFWDPIATGNVAFTSRAWISLRLLLYRFVLDLAVIAQGAFFASFNFSSHALMKLCIAGLSIVPQTKRVTHFNVEACQNIRPLRDIHCTCVLFTLVVLIDRL